MAKLSVVGGTDRETPPSHTPGPWKAVTMYRGDLGYVSVQPVTADPVRDRPLLMASGAYHIAQLYHSSDSARIKLNEANARLMAAAPDLLASCAEFLPILERQLESINPGGAAEGSIAFKTASERVARMRAAIAKATTL